MKFKKKPVVIEARQFLNDASTYDLIHWINLGQAASERSLATWQNDHLIIPTLEGDHRADIGDWIIQGVAGEYYPCKPEIFASTYEDADVPDQRDEALRLAREALDNHNGNYKLTKAEAQHIDRVIAAIDATSNKEPLMQIPPLADGETYIGAIGDSAGNLHHVVLLPGDNDNASWKKQMAWAKDLGGDLPNKLELAMLFAHARNQFKPDWYWSNQNCVNSEGKEETAYAWYQTFDYGDQSGGHKVNNYCRARAVRRLIIE